VYSTFGRQAGSGQLCTCFLDPETHVDARVDARLVYEDTRLSSTYHPELTLIGKPEHLTGVRCGGRALKRCWACKIWLCDSQFARVRKDASVSSHSTHRPGTLTVSAGPQTRAAR
jgi:hypothetical protein